MSDKAAAMRNKRERKAIAVHQIRAEIRLQAFGKSGNNWSKKRRQQRV